MFSILDFNESLYLFICLLILFNKFYFYCSQGTLLGTVENKADGEPTLREHTVKRQREMFI